ncbi:smr domain containing protein [Niveomyces insectorum RCEF 264]|uniref:Smr domain containing protein n=1 Tax=Niveomyces insectorum RCEF 264 TaxID=1081102 RepID=A0A167VKN9_9HYPO|nr:smr domain containing protein [Niveomyces insectorum RCEF 264]
MAGPRKAKRRAPQKSKDEEQQELTKKFGEFIDESLIILFLREQGFAKARSTLAEIAEDVRREEASGFDPSGLQGARAAGESPHGDGVGGSASSSPASVIRAGGAGSSLAATSTSDDCSYESGSQNASSSKDDGGSGNNSNNKNDKNGGAGVLEDRRAVANTLPADSASIVATLMDAFPTLKESDVARALKESADDVDKASDILLNLEHLEQTGQRPKGIDAFFQPDDLPVSRGKWKKKKKQGNAPGSSPKNGRAAVPLDYTLAPLQLDDEVDENGHGGDTPQRRRLQTRSAPPLDGMSNAPPPPPTTTTTTATFADTDEIARQTRHASRASFAAASAAARRGRSDPMFRQVAVVFAERGHAQVQRAQQAESAAADARVDAQSTPGTVDLHFVGVHDGVRIALERTRRWWADLADGNNNNTGVGAALEREGWRVQPGPGHYFVTGKK